ncbi:MAG: UDP-4-amino-4,6-dideoxy-N-acetyl-beta-L-altrosamine transaminase [Candidatus Acidiferrum sp.]
MSATASALSFIPFHRAMIGSEEVHAVTEVLESGWLTTGPRVKQFEAAFASCVGAQQAIAVGSCTAALHLALAAIDLREGDEVLLPTMTFASSGEVILYSGAKPVLVDCAPHSFHIDPKQIERHITPKTRAILPVHYSGYASELDSIVEVARRHNLKIIEDAAHSFPSSYKGAPIGTHGDITCFSFYATKTITTGEGGMITTADSALADRMRILSLHGISRDAWKRYSAEGTWRYDIQDVGYKYNLTDLQAAIGLVQLEKRDHMRQLRIALAERYTRELNSFDAFLTPVVPEHVEHAWHLYVIQVDENILSISRDRVIEELKQRGIGTSVHFIPLHLHSLYQQRLGYREGMFPNAEARFAGSISLPLFPGMTSAEQTRVIVALKDIARQFRR